MRLRKIKLAGFKSFVDPTTLHVPSNLVAVIGPNGCGKSNVIDAVRWVMGESSAKTLRGESMADVIFNGAAGRKPVGQASVELVFDNSEGRIGGSYAHFNEIAVRRQVSRDGQSNYMLNGSRCRRKDITELFLGTGLGPRSYAIIEQGMISKVIESKPEELRAFLEEAAGISLYKARRKEAETRMRHTRENLERLDDLRSELDSQLKRLQRQADAAQRYKTLKSEERLLRDQLQAFHLRQLAREIQAQEATLRQREVKLEEQLVGLRRTEADLEQEREAQRQGNEALSRTQGEVFAAKTEVNRLDQAIRHIREQRRNLISEVEQARQRLDEAQGLQDADRRTRDELQATLADNREALETEQMRLEELEEQQEDAEQALAAWQEAWETFHREAAEPQRRAEVERARINHFEDQDARTRVRLDRLQDELGGLDSDPVALRVGELEERLQQDEDSAAAAREALETITTDIATRRDDNQQIAAQLDDSRRQLQHERGRLASLETLQQAALGKEQGQVKTWLQQRGLLDAQRLAQTLEVEPGWERAVEVALGPYLEAVCVDGLPARLEALAELDKGSLSLFDSSHQVQTGSERPAQALLDKVRAPFPLDALLAGIATVTDLATAIVRYPDLAPDESLLTPDGLWLGHGWVRVIREQDQRGGVLAREQQLRELRALVPSLEQQAEDHRQAQEDGNQALRALEQQRSDGQRHLDEVNHRHSDTRSELGRQRNRLEQLEQRHQRISAELDELQAQIEESAADAEESRLRLHDALEQMEEHAGRRAGLEQQREDHRRVRDDAVQAVRLTRDEAHRLAMEGNSLRTRLEEVGRSQQRSAAQVAQWQQRLQELNANLEQAEDPVERMEVEREDWLQRHIQAEAGLARARDALAGVENRIRALDDGRHQQEQRFNADKEVLQADHLTLEGRRTRWKTLAEQLQEAGADLEALVAALPDLIDEQAWQQRLEQIGRSIQRLGAINLAAIDEYRGQAERKEHLDAQNADLLEALETLEGAIRRIDKETRERFRTTYDKVNDGVQKMFPKLFGGGDAYLALTGDDLLEAGVTIMARPPGKRNSTIHQLSGGEKALTAVALVFAIFELNPAPFCMLDEVDAPLDDANVSRFGRMVQAMSDNTQFIFVTHNKITMEMADQLTGVTMHEPGVSRLVSVDIDAAVELADV
jgi:chromosome segregation protein